MAHLAVDITSQPHHSKGKVCSTRAKYREGRKDTAVKVYTVNQESCFLIIQNVPSVGASEDLKALCEQYGFPETIQPLDEYPGEEYTETYLVKYENFFAARTAKKHLDDRSFFGGILHVCYAPEFETAQDTKKKLIERRKFVANKTRSTQQNGGNTSTEQRSYQKRKEFFDTTTCSSDQGKKQKSDTQFTTYIWAGKEYTVPVTSSADNHEKHLEHRAEVAIRYEQYTQKQSDEEFGTPDISELPDPNEQKNISEFTKQDFHKTNFKQFVPRQLSHTKGQIPSRVKHLDENKIEIPTPRESEKGNVKNGNYSYDETMSDIRKKLLSFSGANLTVNLKGKR